MARLVFNIAFLIILAIFIALNVTNTTSVNVFGKTIENVSVVAVILLSIVLGVLYSFLFFLTHYLRRMSRERMREQQNYSREKERERRKREKEVDRMARERQPAAEEAEPLPDPLEGNGGLAFRGRKKRGR
jgi:uncharacterized integral membrane protein